MVRSIPQEYFLPNNILQKVLTLMMLMITGPEVYVATMTIFLSGSYDYLEDTLTHIKSLKLKSYQGEIVTD